MDIQKKNVIWNAIGSTVNAIISLVFVIVTTRINGVNDSGIFSFGFATACILYVLGTYIIRTYQITDRTNDFSDSDYLFNRIITCLFMLIASIAFVLIRGYMPYKALIITVLCFMKCAEAFAEVLYGFMQKKGMLYMVGVSLFCKALVSIVLFTVVDLLTKNILISSVFAAFSYLIFIFIIDIPFVKKLGFTRTKFSFKNNIKLFKNGFLAFAVIILGTFLINVPRYSIDFLLNDSMQTIYGIIILPATFLCLLGQYIVQPTLMSISESISKKNYDLLNKTIKTIFIIMLALGVVVLIIAYILEEPVLSFVYGIDLSSYKSEMMIIIVGSILYAVENIASYILIAFRKIKSQSVILSFVTIVAVIISFLLVNEVGIMGAAMSYLIVMATLCISFLLCIFFSMKSFNTKWKTE